MSARDNILKRLRSAHTPFEDVEPNSERREIVPMDRVDLVQRFVQKAEALSAHVHQPDTEAAAVETILSLLGDDRTLLAWDFDHIPLPALQSSLAAKDITVADSRDSRVRVGITGVDVALAATGSLVVSARPGRPRSVSLLPYVHIAVLTANQIMPHFDTWIATQSAQDFRTIGNHIVITGASRTADIGMELVLGAHGPAELHIVVLSKSTSRG
jgi:L-lactate dehydrogenase complex protein LldG